jgi:hypothetical protein
VQDLLQTELLLLSLAVAQPGALFLAGDTAQTVASGVCFRFQARCSVRKCEAF